MQNVIVSLHHNPVYATPLLPYQYKSNKEREKWETLDLTPRYYLPHDEALDQYHPWVIYNERIFTDDLLTPNVRGIYVIGVRFLINDLVRPIYVGTGILSTRLKKHLKIKNGEWALPKRENLTPKYLYSFLKSIDQDYYIYVTWAYFKEEVTGKKIEAKIIDELRPLLINVRGSRKRGREHRDSNQSALERYLELCSICDKYKAKIPEWPMIKYYYNQLNYK
jgi:hypothetical protein